MPLRPGLGIILAASLAFLARRALVLRRRPLRLSLRSGGMNMLDRRLMLNGRSQMLDLRPRRHWSALFRRFDDLLFDDGLIFEDWLVFPSRFFFKRRLFLFVRSVQSFLFGILILDGKLLVFFDLFYGGCSVRFWLARLIGLAFVRRRIRRRR